MAIAVCAIFAIQAESAAQSQLADNAVEQLRADLEGRDYRRARQAAWRFGQDPALAEAAVSDLAKALANDDVEVAWHAAEALRSLGPKAASAAPALIAVLGKEMLDPTMGQLAARALGQILDGSNDQAACEALRASLSTMHEMPRFEAAQALVKIERSEIAAKTLEEMIHDGSRDLVYAAARTSRATDPSTANPAEPLRALGHSDEDVRRAAIEALCELGPAAAEPLVAAIQQGRVSLLAGSKALGQLGKALRQGPRFDRDASDAAIKQQILPALRRLLATGDEDACRAAGLALSLLGPGAVPTLVTGLVYREPRVREASALGIERLRETEIVLPEGEDAESVREKIASALVHSEPAVRRAGWQLFSALATPEEVARRRPSLHAALHDDDPLVRQFAAKALARRRASHAPPKSGE
jgi:HEAT repeat protein